MSKNKTVFLSDIHIGANAPTNWYQASVHEPYLNAALQYIIDNKSAIRELVILGDLVDFWTYLPDTRPPPFFNPDNPPDSIMRQNAAIFGDGVKGILGQLGWTVSALDGKVSFVRGNHDMTMTQDLLDHIPTGHASSIQLKPDTYFPLGHGNQDIVCTHGHEFSMLCAQDEESRNDIKPLPLGYYVTRAGAYLAAKRLTPAKPNVADLPNTGEPTGLDITDEDYAKILYYLTFKSMGAAITEVIQGETGLAWTAPILLPDGTATTLDDAFKNFDDLFDTWKHKRGLDGQLLGYTGALDALRYPDVDNDLLSYAQGLAAKYRAKIVVMGHTHVPQDGAQLVSAADASGNFIYANSGFNCPSVPDMDGAARKRATFVEIEESPSSYTVTMMEVVHSGGAYKVQPDSDMKPVSINKS